MRLVDWDTARDERSIFLREKADRLFSSAFGQHYTQAK